MEKIKVIDLLNKIANGEELPKKIKYDDQIYYMVGNNDYENYEYDEEPTLMYAIGNTHNMNAEIEILDEEENKKIGKLYLNDEYLFSNNLSKEFTREDRRLLDSNFKELGNKINEIIDKLNKEE